MPKVKKGAVKSAIFEIHFTVRDLLERMAQAEVPSSARIVAVVLKLNSGFCHEQIAWCAGVGKSAVTPLLKTLELFGFLFYEAGMPKVRLPTPKEVKEPPKQMDWEKPKCVSAEQVNSLISHFKKLWEKRYKEKCYLLENNDKPVMQKLVRDFGVEEVRERIEIYLKDSGDWLIKNTHPFRVFAKQINKYGRREQGNGKTSITDRRHIDEEVRAFTTGSN